MDKSKQDASSESPEHLNQIRDIIFGPQKREFESRVDHLEAKFEEVAASLLKNIEEMKKIHQEEISSVRELFQSKLDDLSSQARDDRDGTRKMTDELSTNFNVSLDNSTKRLETEVAQVKDQIYKDLESVANQLAETKVSRESMAEMLLELGTKIKAGDRISELKLITKKNS